MTDGFQFESFELCKYSTLLMLVRTMVIVERDFDFKMSDCEFPHELEI